MLKTRFHIRCNIFHTTWILYILVLCPIFLAQRTYMRTCECEYITNGKCAYTLLLPIGDSVAAQCDSDSDKIDNEPGQNVSSSTIQALQDQLETLQSNITSLSDWSTHQSRLLSQLQGVIIYLQSIQNSGSQPPPTNPPTDQNSTSGTNLSDITKQIENLGATVENLQTLVLSTSSELGFISTSLTEAKNQLTNVDTATQDLQNVVNTQNNTIYDLKEQIQDLQRSSCTRRGLIVSGSQEAVGDESIIASSSFNPEHGALKGRINNTGTPGAWCPKEPNTDYEWLQFNLTRDRLIFGTVLKGRADFDQWVLSYYVQYATLDKPDVWIGIIDIMEDIEIFPGNRDKNSAQVNLFWQPVTAGMVRLIPTLGYRSANKCMRADVIGCLDGTQ